jgi:hypothetical protein
MAIESINREFEVFMREMVKMQECAQENIESELRRLIRVTVNSCATMYGFSAEEALKRLNSSGEIIEVPVVAPIQQKELEKAEKVRLKELEKAEKVRLKELEKAEKVRLKEFEKAEKANELSERNKMKEQDIASKAIEKAEKLKLKKKKTITKKNKKVEEEVDYDSDASTVLMTDSEDEKEPCVLFQNISLTNEINSIRDVKKTKNWKKLSPGVKLARQIQDI